MIPRRSVLYMPGANSRAMEKARAIDCDSIIFDLEDAVAPTAKEQARGLVRDALATGGYGHRELVVRVNSLDGPWGEADVAAFAEADIAALLFPKVETTAQLDRIVGVAGDKRVWIMIETPLAVQSVDELAAHSEQVEVLVMGTSDLVQELRGRHTEDRGGLAYVLQRAVIAARAAGKVILDGVHLDFRNLDSLRTVCEQGRNFGFDGKTLIHPGQVETANTVFGLSAEEIDFARRVVAAFAQAQAEGKGVAVVDGKLIENLHVAEANRTLEFAAAIEGRD